MAFYLDGVGGGEPVTGVSKICPKLIKSGYKLNNFKQINTPI